MALESKPLFHPEVLRQQVRAFGLPERVGDWQPKLQHWAGLIASGRADDFKETALLPDFLTDIFCGLLGYTGPAESPEIFTFSRERHVEVDGKVADAVLGRFQKDKEQFVAVLEGKGARDPLDHPFAGRRMSAVDQAYRYAFCEDRGLLPAESLKHAFEHRDPYNPRPVWLNFRGLFRAIDEGNAGLNIPAYNGGLFAPDPPLDALPDPDEVCASFKDLGDYDYRPAREVAEGDENTEVRSVIDVDILGHIFEQSITDLERLRLSLEHPGPSKPGAPVESPSPALAGTLSPSSEGERDGERRHVLADETQARKRRKQEGAVYTPAFITRYIVGQALGGVLKQRFEALRRQHESETSGTARKALADPNAYDLTALNEPQRKALIRFWEAWQEALKRLRILDLACGSGAFLIEAFDQLHALYETSNARLE